jgi:hypothetical protein
MGRSTLAGNAAFGPDNKRASAWRAGVGEIASESIDSASISFHRAVAFIRLEAPEIAIQMQHIGQG